MNNMSIVLVIGLERLDQLVLNHNQLTELNAKWFEGLANLHDLKLCHNEIKSIDDAAFQGLEGIIPQSKTLNPFLMGKISF